MKHTPSIIAGVLVFILDIIYFRGTPLFIPLLVVAVSVGWLHFWIDFFIKARRQKELERRFPDFVRNLVGAIKSGMPIGEAIQYVSRTDYGPLSYYASKLANQVSWGIPVHRALISFANGTNNTVIKRAISTVIEAERAGGNIEDVLETVTSSVITIKNLKERRRASIHGQVIQSYIIFIVFLIVMVIIQNFLIPYMVGVEEQVAPGISTFGIVQTGLGGLFQTISIDFSSFNAFLITIRQWLISFNGVFLMLALIEGFFAGIVIGKLAEGELILGLKHSLILMTLAFFLISLSQGVLL